MIRLGRHDGGRQHGPVLGQPDGERLDQRGQRDRRLGQGELGADADPRAGAEGQVGKAGRRRRVGQEAGRVEGVGVGPIALVPMQDPGGDHDHVVAADRDVADPVGAGGLPDDGEGGREQAQGFVDDGPRDGQPGQGGVGVGGGQVEARDLPRHQVLMRR